MQDPRSEPELIRLTIQDQAATAAMGGVLPEQPDPARFQRVLDIGCGPGGWISEAARTSPSMSLFGIDISQRMIEDARQQAHTAPVSERVAFHLMDALLMLAFPNNAFDLVNLRFGVSWLRTWDWPKLLSEMRRVCRIGGVLRLTEGPAVPHTFSAALTHVCGRFQHALFQAGHLFEDTSTGLIAQRAPLLTHYG